MKRFLSLFLSGALGFAMLTSTASISEAKMTKSQKCKIYAKKEVDRMVNRSVGTGLVVGAGSGLILGSILGNKKSAVRGAAIGGVGGVLAGAVIGTEKRKRVYNAAYADCMDY
jgi:uncharacterized protein YcfJ